MVAEIQASQVYEHYKHILSNVLPLQTYEKWNPIQDGSVFSVTKRARNA